MIESRLSVSSPSSRSAAPNSRTLSPSLLSRSYRLYVSCTMSGVGLPGLPPESFGRLGGPPPADLRSPDDEARAARLPADRAGSVGSEEDGEVFSRRTIRMDANRWGSRGKSRSVSWFVLRAKEGEKHQRHK